MINVNGGSFMFCSSCGNQIESGSKYCSHCGYRLQQRSKSKLVFIISAVFVLILTNVSLGYFLSSSDSTSSYKNHDIFHTTVTKKQSIDSQSSVAAVKNELANPPKDVSEIISTTQPKVFTIITTYGFGSGFLIDDKGHVLTNAHVVEGDIYPIIRTIDGTEYEGNIIGYSNTTDVAIIKVHELEGKTGLELEETDNVKIGDEVIALGSPRGYENTATLGNISGVDRTFVIPPFEYEGVYQMSAPIAPGSSGGPLLSKQTGKVIAINSARDTLEINIGFSIPIYKVISMINNWIQSPMLEDDIYALFYYDDGLFYFNDYLDSFGYFSDAGYYSDSYDEYYEIPFDDGYWEFDDWYWEEEYDDYWYLDEYDEDEDWNWDEYNEDEYWYWDDEEYWDEEYDDHEYDNWEDDFDNEEFEGWEEDFYDDEWE